MGTASPAIAAKGKTLLLRQEGGTLTGFLPYIYTLLTKQRIG
jgi:hypothetical protein